MRSIQCVPLNKNVCIALNWEVLNVINCLHCYQYSDGVQNKLPQGHKKLMPSFFHISELSLMRNF